MRGWNRRPGRAVIEATALALLVASAPAGCVVPGGTGGGPKPAATSKPATRPATPAPPDGATPAPGRSPDVGPPPGVGLTPAPVGTPAAIAGLTGKVMAPAALLVGAPIISDHAGGVVSNAGGQIIGKIRYALLGEVAQVPFAGGRVTLLDAAGTPVPGADGKPLEAVTDATGAYAFPAGLPTGGLRVQVDLGPNGRLEAIAPRGRATAQADVDLVSTLTSTYILDRYVAPQADKQGTLDRLRPEIEAETRAIAAGALAAGSVPPPVKLDAAAVVASMTALRAADGALDAQLEVVRKLLVVGAASVRVADGPEREASLYPSHVAVDAAGDVVFTDQHRVRRLRAGRVETIAGGDDEGRVDAVGAAARFSWPTGIAVAPDGAIVVADGDFEAFGQAPLRRIAPDGTVTTLGGPYNADGAARWYGSASLAFDAAGQLVIGSTWVVRRFGAGGFTPLAGSPAKGAFADGPAASATFGAIAGLAVAPDGRVLVADQTNRRLRAITPDGTVSTLAGGPGMPPLGFIEDVAVARDGTVYVAGFDPGGAAVIRKVAPDGTLALLAGDAAADPDAPPRDGQGAAASFANGLSLALAPNGDLWVGEEQGGHLRKVTPAGVVTTVAGLGRGAFDPTTAQTAGTVLFESPDGIARAADGTLYVADGFQNVVRRVGADGKVETIVGTGEADERDGPGRTAMLDGPGDLVVMPGDKLYVADTGNGTVRRVDLADPAMPVTTVAADKLTKVRAIAATPAGDLLALDSAGKRLHRLAPDGTVTTTPVAIGAAEALEAVLAVDPSGTPHVVLAKTPRVLAVAADGTTRVIAGSGAVGTFDGPALEATFKRVLGLRFGPDGQLYLADVGANALRRLGPDGRVVTIRPTLPAESFLNGPLMVTATHLTIATDTQVVTVPLAP